MTPSAARRDKRLIEETYGINRPRQRTYGDALDALYLTTVVYPFCILAAIAALFIAR